MNFKELLLRAKDGDHLAEEEIIRLYRPLLIKWSVKSGVFDEDLYQELCITTLRCIRLFPM